MIQAISWGSVVAIFTGTSGRGAVGAGADALGAAGALALDGALPVGAPPPAGALAGGAEAGLPLPAGAQAGDEIAEKSMHVPLSRQAMRVSLLPRGSRGRRRAGGGAGRSRLRSLSRCYTTAARGSSEGR